MGPSILPGGEGMLAQLYRAFHGVLTPQQVDESEMWQLAALLGLEEEGKSQPIKTRPTIRQTIPGLQKSSNPKILAVMPPI